MRQLKISKSITRRDEVSVEKYLSEIAKYPLLSPEEEASLMPRIRQGDRKAEETLIKANLRFVVSVAKQYLCQPFFLGDIINYGNIGLITAVHRFDETRGFKFISFAVWWIRQSILVEISEHARMVRLPMNKSTLAGKIQKAIDAFLQSNDREPTVEELAELLDLTEEDVLSGFGIGQYHLSLDKPLSDDEHASSWLEILEDDSIATPDQPMIDESLLIDLSTVLSKLSEREQLVIKMLYGIGMPFPRRIEDVAKNMHLTPERVRQIKTKAEKKLKRSVEVISLLRKYRA